MEEAIFPPSPTWFLPNIIATRGDGSVCYGSKNNIVILLKTDNKKLDMLIIHGAHNSKVTAVAFSPSNSDISMQNTIVSGAEDSFVKIWDISTLKATMGHMCHLDTARDLGKIVSLDWSTANPRHIVTVAENNYIVLWDALSNTTIKFSFPKLGATIISCCPYNDKIVAVGGKTGEIYIITLTDKGNIIYRLRGHDNKIHSLSWCPIPYNIFILDGIFEEFLLASACQNKEIFIWRVGSDGKCERKFQVPSNALSNKDGQHIGKMKNSFSYLSLCWLEPYKLYTTSNFGELIYFDFKSYALSKIANEVNGKGKLNKHSSFFIKMGHHFHSKGLYAIAGLPAKAEIILPKNMNIESELQFPMTNNNVNIIKSSDNECSDLKWDVNLVKSSSLLWTAGQDRKLVASEVMPSEIKLVFNCHTLNGFVYCAVVSPHDPNKIAVGVGDGMIRLLNLTDPFGDLQLYWQKIKDRVMTLDWHPKKDGLLAYGTSEGRVGIIDTTSNKLPNVFKPSNPSPVYNVAWGPEFPIENKNSVVGSDFDLYSIVDGTLSLYQPSKLNADPLNLSKIIPFSCKKQTDLCWKPDYSLMAVGNEDGSICLVEPKEFKIVHTLLAYKKLIQCIAWHPNSTSLDSGLSPLHGYFTSGSTDNDCQIRVFNCKNEGFEVKVELVAILKGHHGHVNSVSWSPHNNGRLISSSADGSVQIWDVISQNPLVNFTPVGMPILSLWSPIDPDFILTGCKNDLLCIWKITSQTKVYPSSSNTKKKQKKKAKTEGNILLPKETKANYVAIEEQLKSDLSEIAMAESKSVIKSSKEPKMFSKIWKESTEDDLKRCYYLLKNENRENIGSGFLSSFLCDDEYFRETMKAEEEIQKKANNWNEMTELSLWSGNIKEILMEKIATGDLNDFLVSLAPMISPRVWQDACLSYSATLTEKKFYRKASSYLIACHKIYEAINLLLNANLYLEAFCIARSRLPASDPILKEIIRKCAEWLFKNGSLLKACECYIVLEEYLEVAKICGKKNQAEYLSLAALAAKKSSSFDLEAVEAANAVFKGLETNNFELVQRVCIEHTDLKHLSLFNFIYETIHRLDNEELELKIDILSYIKESFDTENIVFPSSLPKFFHKYAFLKKKEQVFIIITQELSFAVCSDDNDVIVTHVLRALSTCNRYVPAEFGDLHLLYKFCKWLSPDGFFSENSFFTAGKNLHSSKLKSLRAFLGASIVRHLSDVQKSDYSCDWFDILIELKEDFLEAEGYKYFQNLLEVEVLEKKVLKNRSELSKKILERNKSSVADSPSKNFNNCENSVLNGNQTSESEELEYNLSELDFEVEVEEKTSILYVIDIQTEATNSDESICVKEITLNSDSTLESSELESETEHKLEKKLKLDLDVLKNLKKEIAQFEAVRVSSPNPVPVYFMLKKLCEGLPNNKSACVLLSYLNSTWEALN